jgi:histone deacetylase 11
MAPPGNVPSRSYRLVRRWCHPPRVHKSVFLGEPHAPEPQVLTLRSAERLSERDKVVYIDLDAHQGNGVCHAFFDDHRIFLFDMFNQSIYPAHDTKARRRIDCPVPLPHGCSAADYLAALQTKLPPFLDAVSRSGQPALGVYNAGTDVYFGDTLGGMNVSAEGILERDQFVLGQLVTRRIPDVMLLGGGYSRESYRLVATTVAYVFEQWGAG